MGHNEETLQKIFRSKAEKKPWRSKITKANEEEQKDKAAANQGRLSSIMKHKKAKME